jgi:signal peptidase I
MLQRIWKQNRPFFIFVILLVLFRSVIADWNHIPSGSMRPTLIEGDHILVDKMAYDIRFPFSHWSLLHLNDPKTGDIVIFDSAQTDNRMVKRIIGVPGDEVVMINNQLNINGSFISYNAIDQTEDYIDLNEALPDARHLVRWHRIAKPEYRSFPMLKVPEGFYLALGDNRDRSSDSRIIGLIPRNEIVGRTHRVLLSLNYDNYYLPRSNRWLKALN